MENLDHQAWRSGTQADDAHIIDVRTEPEWQDGIIPNAQLLDIYRAEEFMAALEGLDKSKSYYLYCRSGARSGQACMIMQSRGFEKVYNLSGGVLEWYGELVDP